MKKLLTAILAILYLGTSMGATIHLHYCMGKLVSWGLMSHEGTHCTTCGMAQKSAGGQGFSKKDCCKDEAKLLQSEKDQQVSRADYSLPKVAPAVTAAPDGYFSFIRVSSLAIEYPNTNAPPGRGLVPLFLHNRNFRI